MCGIFKKISETEIHGYLEEKLAVITKLRQIVSRDDAYFDEQLATILEKTDLLEVVMQVLWNVS